MALLARHLRGKERNKEVEEDEQQKLIDERFVELEAVYKLLKVAQKQTATVVKSNQENKEAARQLGDTMREEGQAIKLAPEETSVVLGEVMAKVGEFVRDYEDLRSTLDASTAIHLQLPISDFLRDLEKAKETKKDHDKKMEAYIHARIKTQKEKASRKQTVIKISEAQKEEQISKELYDKSTKEVLALVQEIMDSNTRRMTESVCETYVQGLRAFYATSMEAHGKLIESVGETSGIDEGLAQAMKEKSPRIKGHKAE